MYLLGKRYRFSAAHTLASDWQSEEENRRIYGKCANPTGHGHDYVVEVIVSADALTAGTVIGRGLLDRLVAEHVAPRFAWQDLNQTFGPASVTSGENLAVAVYSLLSPHMPSGVALTVRIEETEKNSFTYDGR